MALDGNGDGTLIVQPVGIPDILIGIHHPGDIAEGDRRAIAEPDDLFAERFRIHQLSFRVDDRCPGRAVQTSRGLIGVQQIGRIDELVDSHLPCRQRIGIRLNANCIFRAARNIDLRNTIQNRKLGRQNAARVLIHFVNRQAFRIERDEEDRQRGRIDFAVNRRIGHRLWHSAR